MSSEAVVVSGMPLKPDQVEKAQQFAVPAAVFDAFNAAIAGAFDGQRAVVKQDHVVSAIVSAGFDRQTIFDRGYLNVEEAYRAECWKVVYDKPAYNETYPATFTFSKGAA